MKKEKLYETIGDIDENYISEAHETIKKTRPIWYKWGAVAACLLVVLVSIVISNDFGKMACGHTSHNIITAHNGIYFSEIDKGVYFYNAVNKEIIEIADFEGVFYKTSSGIYLLDNISGKVYAVKDKEISSVGELDYDSLDYDKDLHALNIIDIQDNVVYWTSIYQDTSDSIYKMVFATDLVTGEKREVLMLNSSSPFKGRIVDGVLYFWNEEGKGSIETFDLNTKENNTIYEISENNSEISNTIFYEDVIVFETNLGLYQLRYDSKEAEKLTDIVPTTNAFDRVGNELYYVCERDKEMLVSFNLQTKKVAELVELDHYTYTELVCCEKGYYFTDPSDSNGGLFYYDFESGKTIQIGKK